MGNDRYAGVRRLPDAPIAGESYRNAGSHYKVWQYNAAADTAHVENLTSGWVCTAHHPALYRLHDGSVELQWDYSTDGHFEEPKPPGMAVLRGWPPVTDDGRPKVR